MNAALTGFLGTTQKMTHISGKPQNVPEETGVFFGTLLSNIQGGSLLQTSEKVETEKAHDKLMELLGKLESLLSGLLEEGGDRAEHSWHLPLEEAKGAVSDGRFMKLAATLKKIEQLMSTEESITLSASQRQDVNEWFHEMSSLIQATHLQDNHPNHIGTGLVPSVIDSNVTLSAPTSKDLHKVWQDISVLLQTFKRDHTSEQTLQKAGKDLREGMQKFMQILQSVSGGDKDQWKAILDRVLKDATSNEKQAFQKLTQVFQNRMDVPKSYHQQAQVTGKEMVKWVQQAMGGEKKDLLSQPSVSQGVSHGAAMPMTKVEQHVIHLSQSQDPSSHQKQLIQEFERIIHSSRMFTNPKGNMEMLIRLKPGNLGDLTVKFAQLNGEMAVKILVTSQAAKEMLEGNRSQLRHMFSPQQVMIEKVEASAVQQHMQGQLDNSDKDREQQQPRQEFELEREDAQDDEDLSFHEILMNEKV